MSDDAQSGVPSTVSEPALDPELLAFAESAAAVIPGPQSSVQLTEDAVERPICQQGPCRHYLRAEIPIATGDIKMTVHQCGRGLPLMVANEDVRGAAKALQPLLSRTQFPTLCIGWEPLLDEEIADIEKRRLQAQDREAKRREEEKLLAVSDEPARMPDSDPGVDLPAAPPLPESFDDLMEPEKGEGA